MAPYSMDLRKRVAKAWDAGMDADAVAAKYEVSRAWVHRLIQRRRETGSLAPRKQIKFRRRVLTAREEERLAALIVARPDATLTELRAAVPTSAALSTLWRTIDAIGIHAQKKRYTPTSSAGLMSPPRGVSGRRGSRSATCRSMCFSMNAASRRTCCGGTAAV